MGEASTLGRKISQSPYSYEMTISAGTCHPIPDGYIGEDGKFIFAFDLLFLTITCEFLWVSCCIIRC